MRDWSHRGPLECVSVGFLFAQENGNVTLIPHLAYANDEDRRQGTGMMIIPETAVTRMDTLLVAD